MAKKKDQARSFTRPARTDFASGANGTTSHKPFQQFCDSLSRIDGISVSGVMHNQDGTVSFVASQQSGKSKRVVFDPSKSHRQNQLAIQKG